MRAAMIVNFGKFACLRQRQGENLQKVTFDYNELGSGPMQHGTPHPRRYFGGRVSTNCAQRLTQFSSAASASKPFGATNT